MASIYRVLAEIDEGFERCEFPREYLLQAQQKLDDWVADLKRSDPFMFDLDSLKFEAFLEAKLGAEDERAVLVIKPSHALERFFSVRMIREEKVERILVVNTG